MNIASIIDALNEPDRSLDRFVTNVSLGFLPNIVNQTNRTLIDPVLRDVR